MIDTTYLDELLNRAIAEDIGDGDHTTQATIPANTQGKAALLVKENGILAGIEIAGYTFKKLDPSLSINTLLNDGDTITPGQVAFHVEGNVHSILKAERLVLNIMQRMSGIATQTNQYVNLLKGTGTRILDTRKTTPGLRLLEKEAVRLGGGVNHRIGLYDMIMIKDNHIDFAGGISNAIKATKTYLKNQNKNLEIIVEARTLNDVNEILQFNGIKRILLDNFTLEQTKQAVDIIDKKCETESSGGITHQTIRDYARCGVDFISVGALTHHIKSLDLSLKATFG